MLPILLNGATRDGHSLIRLPKVTEASRLNLGSSGTATCDDPVYTVQHSADAQAPGAEKPYSVFSVAAQNSRSPLKAKDKSNSSSSEKHDDPTDYSRVSGSSSGSSTGFGKGHDMDPNKSVLLVLENMSQRHLKVSTDPVLHSHQIHALLSTGQVISAILASFWQISAKFAACASRNEGVAVVCRKVVDGGMNGRQSSAPGQSSSCNFSGLEEAGMCWCFTQDVCSSKIGAHLVLPCA